MIKSPTTVTKFSRESDLFAPVAKFAMREGFRLQAAELPFYEYRIDLYGFSKKQDSTIAVELKLFDWKRALRQALLYQLCSDLVYIAMPQKSAVRVDRDELKLNGIGLISVDNFGKCSCLLEAAPHSEVRSFYRCIQIEYLKETLDA